MFSLLNLVTFSNAEIVHGLVIFVSVLSTVSLVFGGDPRIFTRGFYCQF